MRQCKLPLLTIIECRLASHLHIPPAEARRKPLPLALLWLNHAAQAEGMETWWTTENPPAMSPAQVDSHIAALRAGANQGAIENLESHEH